MFKFLWNYKTYKIKINNSSKQLYILDAFKEDNFHHAK